HGMEPGLYLPPAAGVSELRSHLDSPDPALGRPAADPCGHSPAAFFRRPAYLFVFLRARPEARGGHLPLPGPGRRRPRRDRLRLLSHRRGDSAAAHTSEPAMEE